MITISIVEDDEDYLEVLLSQLAEAEEFIVKQVYHTAEEAFHILKHPTDIAIIDIQLPGISGIELIKKLSAKKISTSFLVCSNLGDNESIFNAFKSGACGYLIKYSKKEEVVGALYEVLQGGSPMSSKVARRVINSFRPEPELKEEVLSERENEVLSLLAKGLQYKEIGHRLSISHETVKKHLKNIYQKMHVQNKVEAINKSRSL